MTGPRTWNHIWVIGVSWIIFWKIGNTRPTAGFIDAPEMGAATIRPKVSANPIIIAFKIISLEPLLKMMFTFTETNKKVPIISARSILAPFPSSPSPSQF